ncbi:MAG: methyltransferase domain-containing protein [Xanthomonadales bacterium]|nr:methyltransferase domain-containing protein [Xanthomonadales bacterium]
MSASGGCSVPNVPTASVDTLASVEDVKHAYRLLLGREADAEGLKHYSRLVEGGQLSALELGRCFLESAEFRSLWNGLVPNADIDNLPLRLDAPPLKSKACTQQDLDGRAFRYWARELRDRPGLLHRKLWEWCYISQALFERNMLREGSRGLGFAVGQEPLASLFASMGCRILATDLGLEEASKEGWVDGHQHAAGMEHLNRRKICAPELLEERVAFRTADMRAIPADIGHHDFVWSSCALEHLGSVRKGMDFVREAMRCLVPGGIAVHTTEFNCDSDDKTIEDGPSVILRRRDLSQLASELQTLGHEVAAFDFDLGATTADRYVDEPPYPGPTHLKLRIGPYASTSFGLIVKAGGKRA